MEYFWIIVEKAALILYLYIVFAFLTMPLLILYQLIKNKSANPLLCIEWAIYPPFVFLFTLTDINRLHIVWLVLIFSVIIVRVDKKYKLQQKILANTVKYVSWFVFLWLFLSIVFVITFVLSKDIKPAINDFNAFLKNSPIQFILFSFVGFIIIYLLGFKSLLKPKYKHRDPEKRKEAALKLTDQSLLKQIVETDKDQGVRQAAVERLTDQSLLEKIAKTDRDPAVREAAVCRLEYVDKPTFEELVGDAFHNELVKQVVGLLDYYSRNELPIPAVEKTAWIIQARYYYSVH